VSTAAQRSRSVGGPAWFDSASPHPGFQAGHRFGLLFGGGEEVRAQVCHHLLTLLALPLAHLTHPGLWMQRRALTLLVGCPAAGRLSSGRRPAGHTTAPA
jgi:hypothetical protein